MCLAKYNQKEAAAGLPNEDESPRFLELPHPKHYKFNIQNSDAPGTSKLNPNITVQCCMNEM